MTAAGVAIASAVVAAGAALQGAVGFGSALLAAPILLHVDPRLVPGPLLFGSLVLTLLMAYRDRDHIDLFGLKWGLAGRLPGAVLGALALSAIPVEHMGAALGGVVLLAVALSASGVHLRPTHGTLIGAGVLSGFMGTITSIGGPPLALLYQRESGKRLRGTLAGYFVVGALASIAALWWVGRFGAGELARAVVLVPGIVLGFAVSGRLVPYVDRGYTRTSVLVVSALAAVAAIARQLF